MSESDQTLSVVRRVFDAFAAHDVDAFRELLHPDIVLHVGGGPTTIAGIEAVVAAVSLTLQAIPDLRVTVISAFADGPLGAAEVVREGTHTGAIVLPDGTPLPPSGRVVRMAPYVDMLDTLRQMGAAPTPVAGSA